MPIIMKTTKLVTLFIASAFALSSCSNDETLTVPNENAALLKTFKVKRDASGAYSTEFETNSNVKVDKVTNQDVNEFHLYESDFESFQKQSEELFIDGNKLSVSFIDTNTDKKPYISIEDDNITLAKSNSMLKEYSVSSGQEGSVNLAFNVSPQVTVDFVYNEDDNIYEIHLEKGKSTNTSFSRNLTKLEGEVLKIDFINHTDDTSAKTILAKELIKRRKPRILVGNGEEVED